MACVRRPVALAALAFAIGALLYLPSLGHGYVWDDRTLIAENRYLRDTREIGRNLTSDFFRRSVDPAVIGHWRPVVTASYMIDARIGGGSPRAFHVTNALAHGLAAALVVLLALSLGLGAVPSLAAGALFAVHPVHVESVAWISGRTDLLCGVFALVAMTIDGRSRAAAAAATLLAVSCKEMAVAVPAAIALRALLLPGPREAGTTPARAAWRAAWPHLAAIALYAFVRFAILGLLPRAPEAASVGRLALFWTWWSAFLEYARVLVWPAELSIVSPVALAASPFAARVLFGALLATALAVLAWRLRRAAPLVSWGLAAFLFSLVPLVNFVVPVRAISSVAFPWAERFLFVPTIFLAIAAASAIAALSGPRRKAAWALALVLGVAAAARTVARERVWSSQRTLFAAAVDEAPRDVPARVNLAGALLDAGDVDGAADHLERALAERPGDPTALYLLGNVERRRGSLDGAEAAYRRALAIRPSYPQALTNLGLVLVAKHDLDGAEQALRRADDLVGGSPETKVNLAGVMRLRGRTAEAIALYREALVLDPGFVPAREGLARLAP